jgi:hypothetical protein
VHTHTHTHPHTHTHTPRRSARLTVRVGGRTTRLRCSQSARRRTARSRVGMCCVCCAVCAVCAYVTCTPQRRRGAHSRTRRAVLLCARRQCAQPASRAAYCATARTSEACACGCAARHCRLSGQCTCVLTSWCDAVRSCVTACASCVVCIHARNLPLQLQGARGTLSS